MKRINLNKVAVEISKKEGGYKNLNISDIKEVMKIFLQILATQKIKQVEKLLKRYE